MNEESSGQADPLWQPIDRDQRRVLGVLVEKAKTTPEAYPLTLNSLTNGCNQKNNRYPRLDLEPIDVQNAIEKLSPLGAVSELVSGRVEKYRHHIRDWMAVSAVEAAIMAELLLRGAQSIGDLRGRANRMSPIASVSELRPLVHSLMRRNLIVPLTEAGRGQVITHNLYADPEELADLRREFNGGVVVSLSDQPEPTGVSTSPAPTFESAEMTVPSSSVPAVVPALNPVAPLAAKSFESVPNGEVAELRREIEELRAEVQKIRGEIDDLWANVK